MRFSNTISTARELAIKKGLDIIHSPWRDVILALEAEMNDEQIDVILLHRHQKEADVDQLTIFKAGEIATKADEEFQAALEAQFGEKANRFDFHTSLYNDRTSRAFQRKINTGYTLTVVNRKYRDGKKPFRAL